MAQFPGDGQKQMNTRVALRDLLVEIKNRDDALIKHINKRHDFDVTFTIVVGIAAAVMALVMGVVIWSMHNNMKSMAVDMGHMQHMRKHMEHMEDNIRVMSQAMGPVVKNPDGDTPEARKSMAMNMDTMAEKIGQMAETIDKMQKDVSSMSSSVNMMQYDTGSMRIGVGHMSNDTGSMSRPFRVINRMMPW
uniref:Translation initiation factor 2 n=1 Tax=Candidatus Kentrum eta TaxID=2126337 RepID=A0A450URM9_9GAMM|nr:MAG: hypothetical protein BECKH772A_GA0070896_100708 [Candidatus Kentron sp. H]VFJ95212.1 MAG: hypothetical protein BECKH772B_GA0070898_100738 [Candidatus Kentron sp. H]VFK01415.1 MAG: hypothetical protein BECKH772C_GA0070978_100658 [Candidatus Kentron sp. H]